MLGGVLEAVSPIFAASLPSSDRQSDGRNAQDSHRRLSTSVRDVEGAREGQSAGTRGQEEEPRELRRNACVLRTVAVAPNRRTRVRIPNGIRARWRRA